MKWKNKGHEFDNTWNNIEDIKQFYLFGAGDYGNQFFGLLGNELEILGYIDNDYKKQGNKLNGIDIYALSDITLENNQAIIITISQWRRVPIISQLETMGLEKNKDFFFSEEFISIYYLYKYDKVYISTVTTLPSTVCNLNCKLCLNFKPYAKHSTIRTLEQIKNNVDCLFNAIDYVMLFHISGGEPFLYKDIAKVAQYIDSNYCNKIGRLRIITNGTVIPSDEVLKELQGLSLEVVVDDYRQSVPESAKNFEAVMDKLEKFGIRHYRNYVEEWIDLAPAQTDYSSWSEEQLVQHFDECRQSWPELRDGKLYMCNYSSFAEVAGINKTTDDEYFDLTQYTPDKKKELVEFRLRYSKKGYVSFCKKCRGLTESNNLVGKAAIQRE